MDKLLLNLIERLDTPRIGVTRVIPWGCPVPAFGDLSKSVVATLGLNPSNREFVDESGNELDGPARRLHTLKSLRLIRWSKAGQEHLKSIRESCRHYFACNPYNGWFRSLDYILSGARVTYYGSSANACHLDLIPYATTCKWTELTAHQRSALLSLAGDALGFLLRDSPVRLLLLNGRTVINNLQQVAGVIFDKAEMCDWMLPRQSGAGVTGFAFRGTVTQLAGVNLGRSIVVLGYNHNIQSSFGVTAEVKMAIREWLSEAAKGLI
jgi:hypothetical protein